MCLRIRHHAKPVRCSEQNPSVSKLTKQAYLGSVTHKEWRLCRVPVDRKTEKSSVVVVAKEKATDETDSPVQAAVEPSQDENPPSKLLLAKGLPAECNEMMLGMLFQQYQGYVEVRIPYAGLAFIEFTQEPHATIAKKALEGFQLTPNDTLVLTYGKAE